MSDPIDRQAAIDALISFFGLSVEEEYGSAIQEVLNGLPSVQPEQAVKDCRNCKHGKYNDYHDTYFCYNPENCSNWDKWETSVQPEIIRCKDCKYYKKTSDGISYCHNHDDDILWQDDDYCSRGEQE